MKVARRRRRGEGGFTLIELLVVIAVLAILAAIVIFNIVGVANKGKTSACNTDTQSVQTASDAYQNDKGTYASADGLSTPGEAVIIAGDLQPAYIHSVPAAADGTFTFKDGSGTVTASGCP